MPLRLKPPLSHQTTVRHHHGHLSTTAVRPLDSTRSRQGPLLSRHQMRLRNGSSLSLSLRFQYPPHTSLHLTHSQISHLLSHSSSRYFFTFCQQKLLDLNPNSLFGYSGNRFNSVLFRQFSIFRLFDLRGIVFRLFWNVFSRVSGMESRVSLLRFVVNRDNLVSSKFDLDGTVSDFSSIGFSRGLNSGRYSDLLGLNRRCFRVLDGGISLNPRTLLELGGNCYKLVPFSVFRKIDFDGRVSGLNYRCFSSRSNDGSDSDVESENRDVENEAGEVRSKEEVEEVDRVCKVIDELFALDRNMEAVLDECGIKVTHYLVVDVLERFRHARRPAYRFFCWAGQRDGFAHDSRTYNRMMSILGKTRQFESMVSMLEEMGDKGLLTLDTFSIAMRAFVDAQERKKAIAIFELMKKYKFKIGVDTINSLLDSLGRAKLGKEAQLLFEKLKGRFTPDLRTYSVLLNGWCRVKNLMEAGKVWNEMIDEGFKPDIVVHNTMIEGLLKCKKRSDAIKLFEVMKVKGPFPNVRSYTILIRDLCKQMKMEEAVEYFDEMLDSGCEPDVVVYTCLITGFGNQKKMDKVFVILKEMKEKGCPPDGQTYTALIKLLTNRRMPDDAVRVYKKMIQSDIKPTLHIYNMMMKSYFRNGNYEMGMSVWDEMSLKGCCPDYNSYVNYISGLIMHGRFEEACKHIEEMIAKGMKAPQLDYNKFAADFSRAGKPDILEELARKMKFSGKFEASNFFARWAEMMKNRVKRREPMRTNTRFV